MTEDELFKLVKRAQDNELDITVVNVLVRVQQDDASVERDDVASALERFESQGLIRPINPRAGGSSDDGRAWELTDAGFARG